MLNLLMLFTVASFGFPSNPPVTSNLVYGGGSIEISSEISPYQNFSAKQPISGSVMITHDKGSKIGQNSFHLGTQPLEVNFVSSTAMSSYDTTMVSIYSFTLKGYDAGTHTLPSITVTVDGKEYAALPLVLEVN